MGIRVIRFKGEVYKLVGSLLNRKWIKMYQHDKSTAYWFKRQFDFKIHEFFEIFHVSIHQKVHLRTFIPLFHFKNCFDKLALVFSVIFILRKTQLCINQYLGDRFKRDNSQVGDRVPPCVVVECCGQVQNCFIKVQRRSLDKDSRLSETQIGTKNRNFSELFRLKKKL